MNSKLRLIFIIAVLTGAGIISFQLFWLFNAYQLNEDNFTKIATTALQRSIDSWLLQRAGAFTPSAAPTTYVTFDADTAALRAAGSSSERMEKIFSPSKDRQGKKIVPVDLDSANLLQVRLMLARIGSQVNHQSVPMDSIRKLYARELALNNILLPFRLTLSGTKKDSSDQPVTGYINFDRNNNAILASFPGRQHYLLARTALPIFVSLVLMLLTAGCLLYMWRMIWRQKELDEIKNDFIGNMTHELRTPIAILKTTHEALYNFGAVEDKEKTTRYLRMNTAELDKLESKVERILDITRYEKGEKRAELAMVNLKQIMEEAIQRFALTDRTRIVCHYRLDREAVETDKYAIDTIVSNLIDNALKYGRDEGGEVLIAVDPLPEGWQMQVQDNGIGIDNKHLPHLFDKFYRVPTGNLHNVKGYGLGLSYVRELVQLLQGTIGVKSRKEEGNHLHAKISVAMQKIKILLVEDESSLAQVIKETLDSRGFDISIAANGVEGWSLFKNSQPDICVVDIMMPRKDGISLVEDIRVVNADIPIIFLTARTQTADVIKGLEAGADDYMKKPFSMEELILRVKSLTRRAYRQPADFTPLRNTPVTFGHYQFNYTRLELTCEGRVINLSQREADLLQMLLEQRNALLDRKTALLKIWGEDNFFNGRSMDVFITRLRKYLQQDPKIQIVNVRGKGYKLIE